MPAKILKFALAAWRSLASIGTIVGILYLWPDIKGLPAAYGLSWAWLAVIEREHIAYIALAIVLAWLFWIDVRPFAQNWWQKRGRSQYFTVPGIFHCESRPLWSHERQKNTGFYENVFYLVVGNNLDAGETLKRVQARIFHVGPPTLCRIKDSESQDIDIRHGEWAYFEIGRLVSKDMIGPFYPHRVVIDESKLKSYGHNIPRGFLSFEIYSSVNNREYGLAHQPEHPNVWTLLLVLSADGVRAKNVNIKIDMAKPRWPIWCEPPT